MNNNIPLHSPVANQDFIWMAAYMDGTYLSEYDFDTKQKNDFYTVNKSSLIRFGLIGHGMNLYFEVYGGEYKLAGRMIEVFYKDRKTNEEFPLTGHALSPYNNICQCKHGESAINRNLIQGFANGEIVQFDFGYTKNLSVNGVNFIFKTICCVPFGRNFYLNIELTADKDFEDGLIIVRKNGTQLFELDAPLEKGVACSGNFIVT
jgi:hypothetical protein